MEGSYIGNRSILRISGDTLLHIADSNTYMYTFYQSGTFIIPNSEKHKLTLTKQSGDTLFLSKVDKGDDDLDWMYYVKIDTTSPEIETIQ